MRNNVVRPQVVCAVMAVLASSAFAQYRVGDQGHANDANNRIGSGGYNSPSDIAPRGQAATNGQILNGNVSGLGYFHGNAQTSFDPNTVQTNTETGASDRLNAIAAPQNYAARTTGAPQQNITPFYSTARVNDLPAPNYVQTPGGVGLVPAGPQTQQPANDQRLGVVYSVTGFNNLPAPGQLNMPGPVDPSGQQSMISASPLTGIRPYKTEDSDGGYFLSRTTNTQMQDAPLDNAAIQRMRNELNATVVDPNNPTPTPDDRTQFNSKNPAQPNPQGGPANNSSVATPRLDQPGGAPTNAALSNPALNTNLNTGALGAAVNTAEGTRQSLLISPDKQSTQLAELERRLSANKGPLSNQQANANYNQELRLKNEADAADKKKKAAQANPAVPGATGPGGAGLTPGGMSTEHQPAFVAPPTSPEKPADHPAAPNSVSGPLTRSDSSSDYVVTSLATGVKAPGLAKVLRSAETDMRNGKFTAALDSYDTAAAVAPNNPFVTMGRGFAELGASYYGKSEGDLRRTITTEPAVLVGRYDLKGFLGEDRVHFVSTDLREIANSEKQASRPLFLLAFIEHNLGDDEKASADLIEAQLRSGGNDPVIQQMQKLWGLGK